MSKMFCKELVERMVRNQVGMGLTGWGLRTREDEAVAEGVSVISDACDFFDAKIVNRIEVNCSAYQNSDDEGGSYTSYTLSVEIDVVLPGGEILTIEDGNDLSDLVEVVEGLEADDDKRASEYRAALTILEKECGWLEYGETMMERDFWDARGENPFELTREDIEFFTAGGQVDHVGLSLAVFKDATPELSSLSDPPAFWSAFEMERMQDRLAAGMFPEALSGSGQSALNAAAYYGHAGATKALLEAGADPNRVDASAINPVITAAYCGNEELLDQLLAAGGEINGLPHAPMALFAIHANPSNGKPVGLASLIERGLDIYATMPDGGVFHDDIERYANELDHEEQIRVVRAAGLAGALDRAMTSGSSGSWGQPRAKSSSAVTL
jgi:hypothetical protein